MEAELRYARQVHGVDDPSEEPFPRLSTTDGGHGCTLSTPGRPPFPPNELPLLESQLPTWTTTSRRDGRTETVSNTGTDVGGAAKCNELFLLIKELMSFFIWYYLSFINVVGFHPFLSCWRNPGRSDSNQHPRVYCLELLPKTANTPATPR